MPPGSPNLKPDWTKCYFLHTFLDLVSASDIHGRGHKRDVHVYRGVNHLIMALDITLDDVFRLFCTYRWVNPPSLNTFLSRGMPQYWPSCLGSSFPHIPEALEWNCGIYENFTLINTNIVFIRCLSFSYLLLV